MKTKKETRHNFRKCDKCGLSWNVSPKVLTYKTYICPACSKKRMDNKKSKKKNEIIGFDNKKAKKRTK